MRTERNSKKIVWTRTNVGYRVLADGSRSYCYRFRDAGGIQRCIFLGAGSTEREAQAKLAEVTVARSKGDAIRVSREPFSKFADRWLSEREHELAPTTVDGYRWHLEKLIKPSRHFRKPISKITQHDVAAFIVDLRKRESRRRQAAEGMDDPRRRERPLRESSRRRSIRACSPRTRCRRSRGGSARRSPTKGRSGCSRSTRSRHSWTRRRTRGLKWAALIGLGVYAGLRSGEALGLRWQDVDLEANTIRVRHQRDAKSGVLRDLKTKASKREVPIATPLRRALVEWKLKSDYTEPGTRSSRPRPAPRSRSATRSAPSVRSRSSCGINVDPKLETEERAQPRLPLTAAHLRLGDDQGDEGRCGEGSPLDGTRRHQGAARALLTRVRVRSRRSTDRGGHR